MLKKIVIKGAKEHNLKNVSLEIPKEKLVVETDAPYLTPHPNRGKRNEPKYTSLVVEKIAELLEMEYEEVCNLTTNNAKELFKGI